MQDKINRYQVPTVPVIGKAMASHQVAQKGSSVPHKPLGDYLVEAGLLTKSQVDVALIDQKTYEMKFGEIVAMRNWVKQETVEYLMAKVVIPERKRSELARKARSATSAQSNPQAQAAGSKEPPTIPPSQNGNGQAHARRDVPISKPLPSVQSKDGDVNWVG